MKKILAKQIVRILQLCSKTVKNLCDKVQSQISW